VRSVVTDLRLDHPGEDVVVVTHQAVIMLFRYVLDELDEPTVLDLSRRVDLANTAVTGYEHDGERLALVSFNDTSHLSDVVTTDEPDRPVAPR
jgi:broad specificity phosphatase PhoE